MFEKVKRFYDLGLYTAAQVERFADKGKLTPEQVREIIGANDTGKEHSDGSEDA